MAEAERGVAGQFVRALPKEYELCSDGVCINPKDVPDKKDFIKCTPTDSCTHAHCECNLFSYPTKGPDHEKEPYKWEAGPGGEFKREPNREYRCMCTNKKK